MGSVVKMRGAPSNLTVSQRLLKISPRGLLSMLSHVQALYVQYIVAVTSTREVGLTNTALSFGCHARAHAQATRGT